MEVDGVTFENFNLIKDKECRDHAGGTYEIERELEADFDFKNTSGKVVIGVYEDRENGGKSVIIKPDKESKEEFTEDIHDIVYEAADDNIDPIDFRDSY